ncbi:Uncharacterized protein Adt_46229 [Abeliophyllum distichum]|uniref:Uncharacterized protein n=1 Tax=Abeliophyllum distichum TaxID=126358 RepID=A0ABD1P378_9LAMI
MGKKAFPSRRIQSSHRFLYSYLVMTSPQSKTPPWYAPRNPPKAIANNSVIHKSWVIIGPMLQTKPNLRVSGLGCIPENIDEEETEASDGLNEDTREKRALGKDLLTLRVPVKRKKLGDGHEDLESSYVMNFYTAMKRSGHRDHSSVNQYLVIKAMENRYKINGSCLAHFS